MKALWRCPKCGARLVTPNMSHSCGRHTLKALFAHSGPNVFRVFRKYEKMVRVCGPVTMIPQKTRVVFMVRVRHTAVYPRKDHLICGIELPSEHRDRRFFKIERYTRNFVGHYLRVRSEDELDAKVQKWLKESYAVGTQEALQTKTGRIRKRK